MSQSSKQCLDGLSLDQRDPQFIKSTLMPIWDWLYHHYFQVTADGWENVPESGKVMIVGSHNGGDECLNGRVPRCRLASIARCSTRR